MQSAFMYRSTNCRAPVHLPARSRYAHLFIILAARTGRGTISCSNTCLPLEGAANIYPSIEWCHKLTAYRPDQINTRQPGRACNQLLVLHSDSESIHEKWSYNALSPCGKHRTNGLLKQYAAKGCNPHELLDCTIAYPL